LVGVACGTAPTQAREPSGRWTFKQDTRPVKVVVLGGSITAYTFGSFTQFLQASCSRAEFVNRAKSKLGATALRDRFVAQVVRNRRVDPSDHEAMWLVYFGGLNSIGSPQKTNLRNAEILKAAHTHGLKTVALSLAPWGSEKDRRWTWETGMKTLANTQLAVDFVMGRLSPDVALGRYAALRESPDGWEPGELADIAIDLFDSPLRHGDAALRDEARVARRVRRSRAIRKAIKAMTPEAADAMVGDRVEAVRAIPRFFMRPENRGFDAIHPNAVGHRLVAQIMCPSLPSEWGCDCAGLETMSYDRKRRRVVVADRP
jgi:hypothetical protein